MITTTDFAVENASQCVFEKNVPTFVAHILDHLHISHALHHDVIKELVGLAVETGTHTM